MSIKKRAGAHLVRVFGLGLLSVAWGHNASADCLYSISNSWGSGFIATVQITNNTDSIIDAWEVNWHFSNNSVSGIWNAHLSGNYTASNLSWDGRLSPGQSTEFGFQGKTNGGAIETPLLSGTVCGDVSPTAEPTLIPTIVPTVLPTPTGIPTAVPSVAPTTAPTVAPTAIPTNGSNIASLATTSTSYVSSWETLSAVNDNSNPSNSNDKSSGAYGNWSNPNTIQWVQYNWSQNYSLSATEVYWFDDDGGVLTPTNAYIEYWDGGNWVNAGDLPTIKDTFNSLQLSGVSTTRLRVSMLNTLQSTGILEWRVYGVVDSTQPTPTPTTPTPTAVPTAAPSVTPTEPPVTGEPGNYTLDCGPFGEAFLSSGPPQNRINYIILGDGYTESQLDTLLMEHVEFGLGKRFNTPLGEPFGRYKNFINVCVLKVPSPVSGVCDDRTPFKTCGNDDSRLCSYDRNAVYAAINDYLPSNIDADWVAVVLNNDRWWHAGGFPMCWSGGVEDADGAELHEAGHAFSELADEYDYDGYSCDSEFPEVNSTADPLGTAGKWDKWMGHNQVGATGEQGVFEGSRYCENDQYRPSRNSMMRSLFGNNPDTSFNSVSQEQIIFSIWRVIESPYDSVVPAAGNVTNPASLQVNVIDPAVINVDWSINGTTVKVNGGQTLDVAAQQLAPGVYTITANTYDNADKDLVRYRDGTCPPTVTGSYCLRTAWQRSSKTVSWQVTIQ